MKKLTALILALCLLLGLTACGGSSKSADFAVREEAAMEAPAAMQSTNSLTGDTETGSAALPENRKWIITVHMDAETEDLDTLLADLDQRIRDLNGFVEDQYIYNGTTYASRRYRNASLTIRIPAADVDKFTEAVTGLSNVISTEKNLEDITLNYVSTESRLKALQTEEERLLELMAQAEDMSDLLVIEERLTEVRYQLENAASQLRLYDNQVDFATIHLSVNEVQQYTPVAEKTVWERISDGFSNSLEDLGEGLVDFFVWVVINSPYLLLWGVIALAVFLVIRRIRKGRKAKQNPVTPPWQEKKAEETPAEKKAEE